MALGSFHKATQSIIRLSPKSRWPTQIEQSGAKLNIAAIDIEWPLTFARYRIHLVHPKWDVIYYPTSDLGLDERCLCALCFVVGWNVDVWLYGQFCTVASNWARKQTTLKQKSKHKSGKNLVLMNPHRANIYVTVKLWPTVTGIKGKVNLTLGDAWSSSLSSSSLSCWVSRSWQLSQSSYVVSWLQWLSSSQWLTDYLTDSLTGWLFGLNGC